MPAVGRRGGRSRRPDRISGHRDDRRRTGQGDAAGGAAGLGAASGGGCRRVVRPAAAADALLRRQGRDATGTSVGVGRRVGRLRGHAAGRAARRPGTGTASIWRVGRRWRRRSEVRRTGRPAVVSAGGGAGRGRRRQEAGGRGGGGGARGSGGVSRGGSFSRASSAGRAWTAWPALVGEEVLEGGGGLERYLFGQEVAAGQRPAGHGVGVLAPDLGQIAVVAAEEAVLAPEREQRGGDALAAGGGGVIVFEVGAHGRAVVLARGVDGGRLPEAADVLVDRLLVERLAAAPPVAPAAAPPHARVGGDLG